MESQGCAVLGYGTIGALLAGLLAARGTSPVVVANRSSARVAGALPAGVTLAPGFSEAVASASLVFLCVKPQACAEVLGSILPAVKAHTLLVSVAGDVTRDFLQPLWPGPVVRLMPTVTAAVGRGTNLLCGAPDDVARVRAAFPTELAFREVSEDRWNAVAEVTRCGPGLVSALLKSWSDALATRAGLAPREAEALVAETVTATLALRDQRNQDFEAILAAVASPGGVTGEGSRVIREMMPSLWSRATEVMDERHQRREVEVRRGTMAVPPIRQTESHPRSGPLERP